MRAREFIIENTVQEDPAYGLPTLDKHRYSVLDKLVKDTKNAYQEFADYFKEI